MLKILKRLKTKDYLTLLLCTGLIVGLVYFEFEVPNYMMKLTPLILQKAPTSEILKNGGMMLLCTLASSAFAVALGFINSRFAASFSMRLRNDIFERIESFSLTEMKRFSTASLITRSTNDVMQVQMFLSMGVQVIIRAPITVAWAVANMVHSSWQYSVVTVVAVAVLLVTISVAIALAMPKFKKMQTLTDNINRITRENLEGIRVVRAYNAEDFEAEKFEKANSELTKTSLFTGRVMRIMEPMMSLIMHGLTLAVYLIGTYILASNPSITFRLSEFSSIMVFSRYAMQVIMSFMLLTMVLVLLPRAVVSARRINEVLSTTTSIVSGDFDGQTEEKGVVEFRDVSFKYPDAEECVIEHVSFKANRGDSVAFIGSTGSGKSTLINLVPRFYDVTEGQILVDGVDVRAYDVHALRDKLGYISQRAVMFSGSVQNNVAFGQGDNIDKEKVNEALDVACADFVQGMKNKEESFVAAGGTNVSGGQKQRLSIARGLYKDPEILIFDDTFSALDYATDKKLRHNLSEQKKGTTKLIVAQRIGTIMDADLIIVLDEGKVVGSGTHQELLKNCQVYQEIALSQLSKEEL